MLTLAFDNGEVGKPVQKTNEHADANRSKIGLGDDNGDIKHAPGSVRSS